MISGFLLFLISRDCFQQARLSGRVRLNMPDSFFQTTRPEKVIGFCLHILGHTQRNRTRSEGEVSTRIASGNGCNDLFMTIDFCPKSGPPV